MSVSPPRAVPTAPGRLPLIGHAVPLIKDPVGLLQSIRDMGDLVRIQLGPLQVYVVNSPSLVRQMLITDAGKYEKGMYFQKTRPFVGNGLVNSEGEFHRRQRRAMKPAFQRARLQAYTEVMRLGASTRSQSWTPDGTIVLATEMYAIAAEVVMKSLLGSDLSDEQVRLIQHWLPTFVKQMGRRVVSPVDWFDRLPTKGNRQFTRSGTELRALVDGLIQAREHDHTDRDDLLSMLMAFRDPDTGNPMDARQLSDEVMTVMAAGIETSSTTLTWLFHELSRQPEIERHLHTELDTVLGSRPVTFDDLPTLTYTQNIVRETLRLYSPAWILMRQPIGRVVLGDVEIPQGTELLFSPLTIHRDPQLYPNPTRFDPNRWRDADIQAQEYLPFGLGLRSCIGDNFALTKIVTVVATIASRWRLAGIAADTVHEVPGAVLLPSEVLMSPQRRPVHDQR